MCPVWSVIIEFALGELERDDDPPLKCFISITATVEPAQLQFTP